MKLRGICIGWMVAALGMASAHAAPSQVIVAGLGDSITAASVANLGGPERGTYENPYTLSFATGSEVSSQFLRLQEYMAEKGMSEEVVPLNYAVPGVKTESIPEQARSLALEMLSGKYRAVRYVTLLIGANDLCGSRGTEPVTLDKDFRANLMAAFEVLAAIKQPEPVRILVSSLPRIPDLGLDEIQDAKTMLNFTCRTVRDKFFKFCNRLIEWQSEEEYEEGIELVNHTNQLLRSIVKEARGKHPNLRVAFSEALANWKIEPYLLAADCFHPSVAGHELMSQQMWDEQPWFR
jgi:lysophospholipase L1-like esterase